MEDTLNLNVWYDRVDPEVRGRIVEAERGLNIPTNPCPLLPMEYAGVWGGHTKELEEAKKRFLAAKHPFHFASLGDAELALLGCGYPWNTREISLKLRACGFSRYSLGLRNEFRAALKAAALLGLHQRWPPITEVTARVMSLCGFELPVPNAVEVHLPYKMLADGSLFRYLAGKRVVLLGDKVKRLADRLKDDAFVKYYAFLGPIGEMQVVGVYETRGKSPTVELSPTRGSWLDLDQASDWMKKTDFDIALLGCGAVANLMGHRAVKYGKSAFDVGFVFEALLGNSQRDVRPILKDIDWLQKRR